MCAILYVIFSMSRFSSIVNTCERRRRRFFWLVFDLHLNLVTVSRTNGHLPPQIQKPPSNTFQFLFYSIGFYSTTRSPYINNTLIRRHSTERI